MKISVKKSAGAFAENKDTAKRLRSTLIVPTIRKGEELVLDFDNVAGVTQSFVHALIAQPIREFPEALDLMVFENCSEVVQAVIEIVVSYSQDEWGSEDDHPVVAD